MELIYIRHNLTDSVGSGKCTEGSSSSEESWPPGRNPHRPWPCWLPRCKREGKGGCFVGGLEACCWGGWAGLGRRWAQPLLPLHWHPCPWDGGGGGGRLPNLCDPTFHWKGCSCCTGHQAKTMTSRSHSTHLIFRSTSTPSISETWDSTLTALESCWPLWLVLASQELRWFCLMMPSLKTRGLRRNLKNTETFCPTIILPLVGLRFFLRPGGTIRKATWATWSQVFWGILHNYFQPYREGVIS